MTRKVVLITGCTSGIGKSSVYYFASHGWRVMATGRNLEILKQEFSSTPEVECFALDVTNSEDIASVKTYIQANGGKLDALVHNAGFGTVGPFEASADEDIQMQFDVNVFGVMKLTRELLPFIREAKGKIIGVSSIGGQMSFPLYSLYHASKWALEGFMESLQYELRTLGVVVKLVQPGPIQSAFNGTSQKMLKKANLNVYNPLVSKVYPRLQEAGVTGRLPLDVAKVIYKAATASSGKFRYPVKEAKVLLMLRKILPEWAWRFTVKTIFRI